MRKEFVVYQGAQFTVEWYYDAAGKSDVFDYFEDLEAGQQNRLLFLVKRLADAGKIHNKEQFRNEGDKIFAFKPQPDRFLCCFQQGRKVIITNAFCKKQQKLPPKEKQRALERTKDYEQRVSLGKYYDD
jgi:hypothetical protein